MELDSSSDSDDLEKISDRRFRSLESQKDTSSGSSGSNGWVCFFKGEGEACNFNVEPKTLSAIVLKVPKKSYRTVQVRQGHVYLLRLR
jgi:hypothetical protein